MQQRDYILRMIEQAGAVLARLRQMILGGSESAETISSQMQSAARSIGIDLTMARLATADTLVDMVSVGTEVNPSLCWLTAEFLYLDGLEAEVSGDAAGAAVSYSKAARLFSLLAPMGAFLVGWPEASERLSEIRAKLDALTPPEPS